MSPRAVAFLEGQGLTRVRVVETKHRGTLVWRAEFRTLEGVRRAKHFPRTAAGKREALSFAREVRAEHAQAPAAQAEAITLRQLWDQFLAEEQPALRTNTVKNYLDAWKLFAAFVGDHAPAQACTRDTMVRWRKWLDAHTARSPQTMQQMFVRIRHVFRWAEDVGLIPVSSVLRYVFKIGKDFQVESPEEYTADELAAILRHLKGRPLLAVVVIGHQGVRQHAALHLDWRDLDWDERLVTWRGRWDKTGRTWQQPLRPEAYVALRAAWEAAGEPSKGWVFPAATAKSRQPCYTIQSLWAAIRRAEDAAGVPHRRQRAGHGFRRMVVGDVLAATGDVAMAAHAIGDKDVKVVEKHYAKRRLGQVRAAFAKVDAYKAHTPDATNASSEDKALSDKEIS